MSKISAKQAQEVFDRSRCLYTHEQVQQALDRMAVAISDVMSELNPLVIAVMNGGLIACGHLLTRLDFPLHVDYLHATRYRGATTGGDLDWKVKPQYDLQGRTLLVVDDILDEGITLQSIIDYCYDEGAERVYSCVVVEKKHERKHGCTHADFTGLEIEDVYVFGYGMDYKGYLRNAAGIFAVQE